MSDNLKLWKEVRAPDPAYTKQYKGAGGFTGTSVNPVYTVKRLTEQFGQIGTGWGYDIIDDRFDNGHTVFDAEGNSIGLVCIHTIRISLWYMVDGERKSFEQYGHTQFIGQNKYGMTTDAEFAKKSLTDAINKSASLLGFNADVFMGMFDDYDYVKEVSDDLAIKEADNKVEEEIKQRQEYEKLYKDNLSLIKTSVGMNELEKVFASITRKAKRRNDVKGLRELTAAKDKRKEELQKEE